MGVEPPFLYDHPSRYSFNGPTDKGFNPRAATVASWTPAAPKIKRDGPLVEFNRHPDSVSATRNLSKPSLMSFQYLVVPYGNLTAKPMSPSTGKKIKTLRQLQLFLRVHQFIGALGSLFCVIAINRTSGSVGWIIRVAPAVGLLHTLYAVYHLCRSPASRPSGSTASYMVFAALTDTGLLPFLFFSALMAHSDYTSNAYGWGTLFGSSGAAYKTIYAFYLISVVEGSLTVASLILGIYLAILFRKISKLPPDMNPLEANLTARPHKRNKSELTEKHMSGSTASLTNNRVSKTADSSVAASRRVPFMHTRTDSADNLEMYATSSARNSVVDLLSPSRANSPTRPPRTVNPAANARQAGTGFYQNETRSNISLVPSESRHSWLSFCDYEGVPTPLSDEAERELDSHVRSPSPVSPISSRSHSRNENPASFGGQPTYQDTPDYDPFSSQQSTERLYPKPLDTRVSQQYLQSHSLESSPKRRSRDPLAMNPPSPFLSQNKYYDENEGQQQHTYSPEPARNALQSTDGNVATSPQPSSRTSSFVGSGGKTRFYGNLRSSVGSINRKEEIMVHGNGSDSLSDYDRTRTLESEYSNIEIHGVDDDEGLDENGHVKIEDVGYDDNVWKGSGRHVSASTGFDLHGGYAGLGADFGKGMGRRREVSGKVAEEGRYFGNDGGRGEANHGAGQQPKAGAAGWARFKGL